MRSRPTTWWGRRSIRSVGNGSGHQRDIVLWKENIREFMKRIRQRPVRPGGSSRTDRTMWVVRLDEDGDGQTKMGMAGRRWVQTLTTPALICKPQPSSATPGPHLRAPSFTHALSRIITASILHFKEHTTYCLRLSTATGA